MDNNNKLLENQKKPHKFNVIDFLLIVLIIGAVTVLAYIMIGTNLLKGSEDTTILYAIEINPLKNDFLPAINKITPGAKIIDSVRINEIGEVQEVKITDAYSNNTDTEVGVVYNKPYPDHSKVVITVKAKCKKENNIKYAVNGKAIMVGIQIHFRTTSFVGYGNCVYLEEITEDESGVSETTPETSAVE